MNKFAFLIFGIVIGVGIQIVRLYSVSEIVKILNTYKIFFDICISTGTMAAAYFAYLSARSSEMSGRANYVPVIIIDDVHTGSYGSGFNIRNISSFEYATAKNIIVRLGSKEFNVNSLDGAQVTVWPICLDDKDITKMSGTITYEDIFSRAYKLNFRFENRKDSAEAEYPNYRALNVRVEIEKSYL